MISKLYCGAICLVLAVWVNPSLSAQTEGDLQILSSATYLPGPASPDSVVAAVGSDLSPLTVQSEPGQPLPYSLAGTAVAVVDHEGITRPAGLLFASPNQVNFLVPPETKPGPATVSISRANRDTVTGTVIIDSIAPGLYSSDGTGMGPATSEILRLPHAADAGSRTTSDQVFLFLYGTGIRSAKSVEVTANGQDLPVLFAGPEGIAPGLDQVNVEIPENLITGEPILITVIANGAVSNSVTAAIQ